MQNQGLLTTIAMLEWQILTIEVVLSLLDVQEVSSKPDDNARYISMEKFKHFLFSFVFCCWGINYDCTFETFLFICYIYKCMISSILGGDLV